MPHLILEHTANLPDPVASGALFRRLHEILADVGGIDIGNCKSRAVRREDFLIGNGQTDEGFVHLDVRFLEGRPEALKQELGGRLLEALREAYAGARRPLQITVEIGDIPRALYFKHSVGPPG